MIGDIVGEVRISAGMGSTFTTVGSVVSEWAVASDTDGEVGVLIGGGSFKGGGGSSPSASSTAGGWGVLYIVLVCSSGTSLVLLPMFLSGSPARPCHLMPLVHKQTGFASRDAWFVVQAVNLVWAYLC